MRPMWIVASILLVGALIMLVGGVAMQMVLHIYTAPLWVGIFAGILLSIPLEIWDFPNPDVIIRAITLKDRLLMVCFGLVIGVGAILLYALNLFVPMLHWGIKAFFVPGVVIGGLIFGAGVAVAGYFPGTIWIALGQGRRDAIYAVIGGLLGALAWSLIFGPAKPFFWETLNFGPITWPTLFGLTSKAYEFMVAIVFGLLMISMWLFVPRRQGGKACVLHLTGKTNESMALEDEIKEFKEDYKKIPDYVIEAVSVQQPSSSRVIFALAFDFALVAVAVIVLRQIFGESTTYSWIWAQALFAINPHFAASLPYFQLFGGLKIVNGVPIDKPFSEIGWEPLSDLGTFLGGLISSVFITRRFMGFKQWTPHIWTNRFGTGKLRPLAAFLGAFMVLFGARMANGCASGHILSGNLQMAVSSFAFFMAVLAGAIITAYIVYGLRPWTAN
ncbi:MAG: YeeE/YedE thiosulfate transporter family protein [Thermocladium sp.]|jgi:uncharacterized membrane protein YedE/YeeE